MDFKCKNTKFSLYSIIIRVNYRSPPYANNDFGIFREDKLFIGMKRDILTEEELNNAARTWTPNTFIKFYSGLYGIMTMEEFRKFN